MRTRQDRMEIPCGTGFSPDRMAGPSLSDTTTLWDAHREPVNGMEALMSADFDEYPDGPVADSSFLEEMESILTPKEAAVINFMVFGQMSLTTAGRYLGAEFPRRGVPKPYSKNAVRNIQMAALAKMRKYLEDNDGNCEEPVS